MNELSEFLSDPYYAWDFCHSFKTLNTFSVPGNHLGTGLQRHCPPRFGARHRHKYLQYNKSYKRLCARYSFFGSNIENMCCSQNILVSGSHRLFYVLRTRIKEYTRASRSQNAWGMESLVSGTYLTFMVVKMQRVPYHHRKYPKAPQDGALSLGKQSF